MKFNLDVIIVYFVGIIGIMLTGATIVATFKGVDATPFATLITPIITGLLGIVTGATGTMIYKNMQKD